MAKTNQLLVETCQSALAILPCNLAWMLVSEGKALYHQAIATDRGPHAGDVFLRLVSDNNPEAFSIPLDSQNLLANVALGAFPRINFPVAQIETLPGGEGLHRALTQLRLVHAHFLPLYVGDQLTGLFVLAGKEPHDDSSPRGKQIVNALTSQAGTVIGNVRLVADLAAREEQMRAEQTFRKMILDTMGDSLVVVDDEGVIRYLNNRLLRMSGYSRSELQGHSVGMIFHPDGRDKLVEGLLRSSGSTVSFSQRIITKDGRTVPVLMSRAVSTTTGTNQATVLVLSDLTEQVDRERALERQGERLRALTRTARAVSSALTLDEVVTVMAQSAVMIAECTSACVFLKDEQDADRLVAVAAVGIRADTLRSVSVPIGQGIAGIAAQDRQPQLVPVVETDQASFTAIERVGSSVIAVPLMILEQVIGVLEVIDKTSGEFAWDDVEILENLAASGAVAIENARLFEQTQQRVNELSTLLESSAALSSTLEIGSVLEFMTRRLIETMNVVRCSIGTYDRFAKQLIILAEACNAYWPGPDGPSRPITTTPFVASVLQSGKSAVVWWNSPSLDPRIADNFSRTRMRGGAFFALRLGGGTVGLLELYTSQEDKTLSPRYLRTVEETITRWQGNFKRGQFITWRERDPLNDLTDSVMALGEANWCLISALDSRERSIRVVREFGFGLWDEKTGATYQIESYPSMAFSLEQVAPMTLQPVTLANDPQESRLMAAQGTRTGLIIPLMTRGETSGLIKLLDNRAERRFDLDEISLCQGIANVVSNAMENARLYQSLEKRADALQTAYNQLHEADKIKDDLIQNLSHELQTPLHQVIMELNLLIDDAFGELSSDQSAAAESIMNRVTQLGDLVRGIVSLRSSEQLNFQEITPEGVIHAAVQEISARASRAGVRINQMVEPDLPAIRGDSTRLIEMVSQILDNALKFSPNGHQVDVQADNPGGAMVHFCIQDYGIGIPKGEFEKIFQRGYQVDGSMTRRFGGMGLGLAIAKQIVDSHGGKIWVESTVGQGSRFHILLPKADPVTS
ncbi:MAG TPA: ATP-binding protein [Aggregatilineales bacterium]|nr:ATP-binding protein [Aggregatilineales bacterium]